jgi:predicted hotdog family 3-hydroxylacyl-ACP dehydratase
MSAFVPVVGLVPQTGAMCLLDEVVSHDEAGIVCRARRHRLPDHPLANAAGQVPAVVSLEYAAQAAAAHGALSGFGGTCPIRRGFLASARDFKLHVLLLSDLEDDLTVSATKLLDASDSVVYEFKVICGTRFVSEGRLSVFFAG